MAESDWTDLGGAALDINNIDRGVTTGIARPNGGGSFVFGFNTLTSSPGAAGKYLDLADFNPITTPASAGGGSIRGAIRRGVAGNPTGFSPFFFIGADSAAVEADAYMLGLDDASPHRIVLRKGTLSEGIPSDAIGSQGILLKGNTTYSVGTWLHVRLDMIVNLNGDVILQVFENDLNANVVTAPVWTPLNGAGNNEFVDDALQINSGGAPLASGFAGFGFRNGGNITRAAFFDHIEVSRQLP